MNTSADAAQNTMDLMVRTPGTENIRLRDIRELSLVAENPRVFSSEIPVYFRVDLARAILLHDLVKNGESTYAVYGDLDMLPMSEAELFDEETVDNLKSFGLVMAKGGTGCGFENGFQITSHHNINMLNAINFAIIKQNIERGKIALEQGYFAVDGFHDGGFKENGYRIGGRQTTPMCGLQQIVYESYPNMFEYFYALDNCFKIDTCLMKGIDIKDVTHEHLGLSYINLRAISLAIPLEELLKIVNHNGLLKIPSKHVSLPGSAHKFNDGV